MNEIKPERRYEKEAVRRLMLGLMEDFLAGCSCPESPLEKRISQFHADIGHIASPNAVHALFCSHRSECFMFMVMWPGSRFLLVAAWVGSSSASCRGRARWGKWTILKHHCLSGWAYGRGRAYSLGVNLRCSEIQLSGTKRRSGGCCCCRHSGSPFLAGGQAEC